MTFGESSSAGVPKSFVDETIVIGLNDEEAVKAAFKEFKNEIAAVIIEPIPANNGLLLQDGKFLNFLRDICSQEHSLLIFDEVQTGMGRTGTWFGYQQTGVQPDVLTLAKGLAGGVACGAMICRDELAADLRPGMHASTFGGNSLAMAAGLAVGETIEREGILEHVSSLAEYVRDELASWQAELPIINEIRVCGMMIGIELTIPSTPAVGMCMERGVLINATNDTVIRLLPALNVTREDLDEALRVVRQVLAEMANEI